MRKKLLVDLYALHGAVLADSGWEAFGNFLEGEVAGIDEEIVEEIPVYPDEKIEPSVPGFQQETQRKIRLWRKNCS